MTTRQDLPSDETKRKRASEETQGYLFFPSLLSHLSLECSVRQLLKTQESGKVVIADRIQAYPEFLYQTFPVNSQVLPVLRRTRLYCCPLTAARVCRDSLRISGWKRGNPVPAYTHVTAHSPPSPRLRSEETPSVTFSLRALLPAKTIKANGVQMFERLLPTSQCSTHSYP